MSLWWSRCNIYRVKSKECFFFTVCLQMTFFVVYEAKLHNWPIIWHLPTAPSTESWSGLGGVACSEVTSHVIGHNWNRVLYIQLQNLATPPHGLDIKSSVLVPNPRQEQLKMQTIVRQDQKFKKWSWGRSQTGLNYYNTKLTSSVLRPYHQSPAGPRWASAGSCLCRQVYHRCRHRSHTHPLCHPCRGRPGWR